MRKKLVLTSAFFVSLLPMLMNQYGGLRGVQEITGMLNLLNPVGISSVLIFVAGVWVPFRKESTGKTLGALGTAGMVVSEIYTFFTWHVMTITGEISFRNSVQLAYPEFYIGLFASVSMIAAYFVIHGKKQHPVLV